MSSSEAEDSGTLLVLTEHGIYLAGQEQPAWREHGTAQQLDTLAAEFTIRTRQEEELIMAHVDYVLAVVAVSDIETVGKVLVHKVIRPGT